MTKEKILVTGCAGFIGFHLCKELIKQGNEVFGIDNINDYYDISLKHARLKELGLKDNQIKNSEEKLQKSNKYDNFHFLKINITNRELIQNIFTKFSPNKVVNLAAQAGVQYSLKNPYVYAESNILGFLNIIELCKKHSVEGFIYASSSSVYGGNKKMPFSILDRVDNPISFYGVTKRANELIAHTYSHLYGLPTTGLRYFTVYGPWGRPDMAINIFTKNIMEGKPIKVFNNGEIKRDFTYIDDIISGTISAIRKNYNCEIFNIGNNRPERLMDVIYDIEKKLGKKAKINFFPRQLGDPKQNYANIKKTVEMLNYKPSINIAEGINNFIEWYLSYFSLEK